MTEFLGIDGGRIPYDVTGRSPLVVPSHGITSTDVAGDLPAHARARAGSRRRHRP